MIKITKTNKDIIKNCMLKPNKLINAVKAYMNLKLNKTKLNNDPLFIDVEPTIICNLKCKMCHVPIWNRKHPNLSFGDFKRIIDNFPNLLLVKIQGMGEPLFNKELVDMIKYARKKGIAVRTTSNATILNDEISKKLIESGLNEILFSVDGATKKTFEGIRIGANFENVLRNIRNFVKLRNRIKGKNNFPRIMVWTVVTKENMHEVLEIIKIVKNLGVDELTLQMDLNSYGNSELKESYKEKNTLRNDPKMETVIKNAKITAKRLGVKLNIFFGDVYSKKNKCKNPWVTTYITVDKFITPCCIRPDPRGFNLGSLKEKDFRDFWNGKRYVKFRKAIVKNKLPRICEECYQ